MLCFRLIPCESAANHLVAAHLPCHQRLRYGKGPTDYGMMQKDTLKTTAFAVLADWCDSLIIRLNLQFTARVFYNRMIASHHITSSLLIKLPSLFRNVMAWSYFRRETYKGNPPSMGSVTLVCGRSSFLGSFRLHISSKAYGQVFGSRICHASVIHRNVKWV